MRNKKMSIYGISIVLGCALPLLAIADIIPTDNSDNLLYYKIGGASDFALPPVENTQTIDLSSGADLGAGYSCGAFNPLVSITNTFNNIKSDVDNLSQNLLTNATGSLAEMPMYFLAQANPTAYNLINNLLLKAHNELQLSVKSCQETKDEIAAGKNPYQDWATLSVNHQWQQDLSLTSSGNQDINQVKQTIDDKGGGAGVPWIQGQKQPDNSYLAGGDGQPPVQVVNDTTIAGYNALLMRDLNNNTPAPSGSSLANNFHTPQDAASWISNVVGEQKIITCTDPKDDCKKNQGTIAGRGLLPWITTCDTHNPDGCANAVQTTLGQLVSGQMPLTKDNLERVSADNLVITPQVIAALRGMDANQQNIVMGKLAQEVATQRVVEKALLARDILQAGSEVPVIAANTPAQRILQNKISLLDKDIQSLAFAAQIRKQMMSNTVMQVLQYTHNQQQAAIQIPTVTPSAPLMQNSSLPKTTEKAGGKS